MIELVVHLISIPDAYAFNNTINISPTLDIIIMSGSTPDNAGFPDVETSLSYTISVPHYFKR